MGREEIQWEGGQRGAWQRHRAGGTWRSQNHNYTWRSTCLLEVCTLLSLIAYGYLFSQAELLIEELGWFLCRSWRNQIFWGRITLLKSNGTLLCPLRPPRPMQTMMNWIPLGWNGLGWTTWKVEWIGGNRKVYNPTPRNTLSVVWLLTFFTPSNANAH